MINWLWKKMFGDEPRLVVVQADEREEAMLQEQMTIQRELGFDPHDNTQGWLRLHQLLKSHEDRITALEGKA
jgi:hypothetical protein